MAIIIATGVAIIGGDNAAAEVYFSDGTMEIFGDGPRSSRTCTAFFRPTMIFGGDFAPKLILEFGSASRVSIGVRDSTQYSHVVVLQDNVRRPFKELKKATIEEVLGSESYRALKSHRLFFVTAQHSKSAEYASSRYEYIDLDAALAKVGANCPFDVESLMTDVSSREQAERALSILRADLTLIRWALNKRYTGVATEPEPRTTLTEVERSYLRRYAADNGLPISRYLTSESMRRLVAEGQSISDGKKFVFEVCNHSEYRVAVAVAGKESKRAYDWTVRGWAFVDKGACKVLAGFAQGRFYAMAQISGDRKGWYGQDQRFCVEKPGPFERASSASCSSKGLMVGFRSFDITGERYTWVLDENPTYDPGDLFSFEVCNRSSENASLAVAARLMPESDWTIEGWWTVNSGSCSTIGRFAKGKFYATAKAVNGLRGWFGTDSHQCVEFPGPFKRNDHPGSACPSSRQIMGFHEFSTSDEKYTWSIYGSPTFGDHEFFEFEVCNHSAIRAVVAMMSRERPDESFVVHGWHTVSPGSCDQLGRYARGTFYATAMVYGNYARGWWQNDGKFCVSSSAFSRTNGSGYTCRGNERLMPFRKFEVTGAKLSWTLN